MVCNDDGYGRSDHSAVSCCCWGVGLRPYQQVVLWQPVAGMITAVMMVAMLKLGHENISWKTVSAVKWFPTLFTRFSMGILRWSQIGSGRSLSQLVCTMNQFCSESSQAAWTPSVSRSMTVPSLAVTPAMMQQTGAAILSLLRRLTALAYEVSSSSTFLSSQQVGMALFLITLIRSSSKLLAARVSTLIENPPNLTPVRAKTLPTTVSTANSLCPSLQYSTLTSSLASSSHISKSRLRPCMIWPFSPRTRKPVQAAKVENSYMKLKKKIFSKGYPLSLARASISATKSWYLNSFLANHYTPSQKPFGIGSRSKYYMKRWIGSRKSLARGAQRTSGGSLRETLQVRGLRDSMGPTWGTIVAMAMPRKRRKMAVLLIFDMIINRMIVHVGIKDSD